MNSSLKRSDMARDSKGYKLQDTSLMSFKSHLKSYLFSRSYT